MAATPLLLPVLVLALAVLLSPAFGADAQQQPLKFRPDGTFRIVQVALRHCHAHVPRAPESNKISAAAGSNPHPALTPTILDLSQFTDLHYGEAAEFDVNSARVQTTILKLERPDLVVMTGDSGTAGALWSDVWTMC